MGFGEDAEGEARLILESVRFGISRVFSVDNGINFALAVKKINAEISVERAAAEVKRGIHT